MDPSWIHQRPTPGVLRGSGDSATRRSGWTRNLASSPPFSRAADAGFSLLPGFEKVQKVQKSRRRREDCANFAFETAEHPQNFRPAKPHGVYREARHTPENRLRSGAGDSRGAVTGAVPRGPITWQWSASCASPAAPRPQRGGESAVVMQRPPQGAGPRAGMLRASSAMRTASTEQGRAAIPAIRASGRQLLRQGRRGVRKRRGAIDRLSPLPPPPTPSSTPASSNPWTTNRPAARSSLPHTDPRASAQYGQGPRGRLGAALGTSPRSSPIQPRAVAVDRADQQEAAVTPAGRRGPRPETRHRRAAKPTGGRGGEREPVKVCTVARAKFLEFFEPCVPDCIWSLPCAHGRTQRPLGNQKLRPQHQSLKGRATPNFTCSPPTGSSTSLLPKPARNSPSGFSAATAASRKSSGEGGVPESRLELRLYW